MQHHFTFPIRRALVLLLLIIINFFSPMGESKAQTPAFPEAEGSGKFAKGGRYGEVYIVTNLNDSGPGSFRDAVSRPNRIVVFEVGGIIHAESRIIVSKNITIAGQTAPGDGLVIYGDGITFTQASNTIVRYLRVRMGKYGTSGADAMTLTDNAKNIIFDHISASWGRDETFSITGHADSITIQNSIIGQGLETHSCGGLMEPSGLVSLFRNLYIDNNTRNPKVKNKNQFVNNIVYNWGRGGGYIMGGSSAESRVNIVNNYYIDGPSTSIRPFSRGTDSFIPYAEGNYHDGNLNGQLDGELVGRESYQGISTFAETPYDYPFPEQVMTAEESYHYILANAGANYPTRDQVDRFMMDELRSLGTIGKLIANEKELPTAGPGEVFSAPQKLDTDRDGMPDSWELEQGLDPQDASDAMLIGPSGYANVERYINELIYQDPEPFVKPISEISAKEIGTTSLRLHWKNNEEDYQTIYLEMKASNDDFIPIDTLGVTEVSFFIDGLLPNTTYQFRLTAADESAEALPAISAAYKTLPVPTAPSVPSAPSPGHSSDYADTTSVTLTWEGSENSDYYKLYFGSSPEQLSLLDSLSTTLLSLDSLLSGTSYYWRVDAVNALGSTEGDLWSFRTRPYIARGLVGAWLMDTLEGTAVMDSSGFANEGEVNELNDYSWTEGKVNGALDFSSAENPSHVFIPHADQLYFDYHSFAISMWLKSNQPVSQAYLIHKGTFKADSQTGGTGQWFGIELKDGNLRFSVDDNSQKTELSASSEDIYTGDWVHLVAIRDTESSSLKIYMNGALYKEVADRTQGNIGQYEPIILGNSNGFGTPFRGQIDEVKIYNHGLSEQEVLALFHTSTLPIQPFAPSLPSHSSLEGYTDSVQVSWKGGINTQYYKVYLGQDSSAMDLVDSLSVEESVTFFDQLQQGEEYYWQVEAVGEAGSSRSALWNFHATSPKGLVGYWKMDEQGGMTVMDWSDYQQDGEACGYADYQRTAGKYGRAMKFDHPISDAAVAIPHAEHLKFDQNSFTLSMWVSIPRDDYKYSNGKDSYLIHKGSFADQWYGIQLRDGRLTFAVDDDKVKSSTSLSVSAGSPHTIFGGQWVHVVAVLDRKDGKVRLFINGQKASEASSSSNAIGASSAVLFGNSDENKPYRDLMDEVRLYNFALSETEIHALYKAFPQVSLQYKNGESNKPFNNQIKPYFNLQNADSTSISLDELSIRYWFTPENYSAISSRVDYAALGRDRIHLNYVPMEEPHTEAFGYMELSFEEGSLLASGQASGIIQTAIFDDSWSDLDETNDYSAREAASFIANPSIGVYLKGELIWGKEPEPVESKIISSVWSKHKSGGKNTINKSLTLLNEGNVRLQYEDLSLRYWIKKEGNAALKAWVDYAKLGAKNIDATIVDISADSLTADYYLELKVDKAGESLAPLSETGEIAFRLTKTDWSELDENNDHSFQTLNQWADNENIGVFYQGNLISGTAPSPRPLTEYEKSMGSHTAASSEKETIAILYPNPTQGEFQLQLAESVALPTMAYLYDSKGLLRKSKNLNRDLTNWDINDLKAGTYFIHISQNGEYAVFKIIKE